MSEAYLEIDRLTKMYGGFRAINALSLAVEQGQMVALLGPSGCGKTTALRTIAGFVHPTGGDIRIEGASIVGLPPYRREMGIVFQSYALFPHMTVAKNIAFALEMQKRSKADIDRIVGEMLALVKLDRFGERYPREISGGQQQRVALARALAAHPRLLLLDEPLSNLDAALRMEVAREIRILQKASGITTIMVTHDQDEAMAMADILVVMKDGTVQQIGSQRDLYETPATPFVASFIGGSNLVKGTLRRDGGFDVGAGEAITLPGGFDHVGGATLALRPERLSVTDRDRIVAGRGLALGTVELTTYLGHVVEYLVRIGDDVRLVAREAVAAGEDRRIYGAGDAVAIQWDPGVERVFDLDDTIVVASAVGLRNQSVSNIGAY